MRKKAAKTLLYLQFKFANFKYKEIIAKAAQKMLVKLNTGVYIIHEIFCLQSWVAFVQKN